jgi:type VI secretion system VgrG family protein
MPDRTPTELFHFASAALPPETFHVTHFSGTEGLNTLFSFTIDLVSPNASVDAAKVLGSPAIFTIRRDNGEDAVFRGFPARMEQGGLFNGYAYYQVELRPAFWKLTKPVQSAIFLDKSVQDVARELLNGQQFFNIPHEFRLTRSDYPKPEFAMQYGESVYDYILWRMEEQGAYFYFAPDGDRVIFADAPQSHDAAPVTVRYSPASGLEGDKREEVLTDFILTQTPLPRRVVVRSFDWKKPNTAVVGTCDVSAAGMGDVYLTNEDAASNADASRIAKIRAEELICRSRVFTGVGSVPVLRPGVVFKLQGHYSAGFNRDYMVTEITHEGAQETFLSMGLGIPLREAREHLFYRNSFSCIASDVPYRPARTAPRAHIPGVIRAFVDGAGSGARAEMDQYGRYKLLFPFDVSGRKGGNASCWIRMAQPQVGKDSGMSFPLLPGAEVTVAFLDGNPDRPVITGALPNGETGALTGSGNANFSGIRTPGGNQLTINDTDTHQGISLQTASGLGLTMTSGSLGATTQHQDVALGMTSIAGTEIANMAKTLVTGCKVQSAACMDWAAVITAITQAVQNCVTGVFNSLAEKAAKQNDLQAAETDKWASDITKTAGMAIINIVSSIKTWISPTNHYGAALIGSNGKSASTLQVWPSTSKMLSLILTWLTARTVQFGTEGADSVKEVKSAQSKAQTSMDTHLTDAGAATPKTDDERKAAYTATTNNLAKQISEAMSKGDAATAQKLQGQLAALQKDYNVLYNDKSDAYYKYAKSATQRRAMVSAANDLVPEITAIMLQFKALSGCSKDHGGVGLASPDRNVNLNAMGTVSAHSQKGIYLDTKSEYDNATTWGIGDKDYVKEAGISGWKFPRHGMVASSDKKFISLHTDIEHHAVDRILEKSTLAHRLSNLHLLETVDGKANFSLYQNVGTLYTEGNDGYLIVSYCPGKENNSTILLTQNYVKIKKGNDSQINIFEDDTFVVKVKDNLIRIDKDGNIGFKSSKGSTFDMADKIILAPKQSTKIGDIKIKGSAISAQTLTFNSGAIKITGGAGDAATSFIAKAAGQVASTLKQQDARISQLEQQLQQASNANIKGNDAKSDALSAKQKASNAVIKAKLLTGK